MCVGGGRGHKSALSLPPTLKKKCKEKFVESDKRFGTINPLHHQTCKGLT